MRSPYYIVFVFVVFGFSICSENAFSQTPKQVADLKAQNPLRSFEAIVFGSLPSTAPSAINPEITFDRITNEITALYAPFATKYGATLVVRKHWADPTINAFASRSGNQWFVDMYGGLFRHPAMTSDGYALVTCHEMTHHFGGYPFYSASSGQGGIGWAAAEGNADYTAALSCLAKYWTSNSTELATNLEYSDMHIHFQYPIAHGMCAVVHPNDPARRGLCTRTLYAGRSFAELNYVLAQDQQPEFGTWDTTTVSNTIVYHPNSQCRLDTLTAAGLCRVNEAFPTQTIPGKFFSSGLTVQMGQRAAAGFSCMPSFVDAGLALHFRQEQHSEPWAYRPKCWFKSEHLRGPNF